MIKSKSNHRRPNQHRHLNNDPPLNLIGPAIDPPAENCWVVRRTTRVGCRSSSHPSGTDTDSSGMDENVSISAAASLTSSTSPSGLGSGSYSNTNNNSNEQTELFGDGPNNIDNDHGNINEKEKENSKNITSIMPGESGTNPKKRKENNEEEQVQIVCSDYFFNTALKICKPGSSYLEGSDRSDCNNRILAVVDNNNSNNTAMNGEGGNVNREIGHGYTSYEKNIGYSECLHAWVCCDDSNNTASGNNSGKQKNIEGAGRQGSNYNYNYNSLNSAQNTNSADTMNGGNGGSSAIIARAMIAGYALIAVAVAVMIFMIAHRRISSRRRDVQFEMEAGAESRAREEVQPKSNVGDLNNEAESSAIESVGDDNGEVEVEIRESEDTAMEQAPGEEPHHRDDHSSSTSSSSSQNGRWWWRRVRETAV